MAIDLVGKEYSPGQIQKSTWDVTNNAVRVNVVSASGGGGATEATQLNVLTAVQALNAEVTLTPTGTPVYYSYAVNVTTSAYVTLVASTPACSNIEIFDSSGQALYLATGAAASEVNKMIVVPGGNGRIPFTITAGTRLSLKAITADATTGYITVNYYV